MIKNIIPVFFIFVIIVFHDDVITGTRNGLMLWYRDLIPSLLPFIIITNALSEMKSYQSVASVFRKFVPNIYEIIAIILGNLCGYPVGAKILNDLVTEKCISYKKANTLLALSSQASPMFLIGYGYNCILEKKIPLCIFLISIYLPTFILYIVKTKIYNDREQNNNTISHLSKNHNAYNINNTFMQTASTIVIIGFYVIIFSIIINIILNKTNNLYIKCILSFMEITNGLMLLKDINISTNIFLAVSTALSSFGGLCTAFQIKSVLNYRGASIKKYLSDKILLSAGTLIIITFYLHIKY